MKQLLLLMATVAVITSCGPNYKQAPQGMKYKIYPGSGDSVKAGQFMEMSNIVYYQDSLLHSSIEMGMPLFVAYDTAQFPPEFKVIFSKVRVGDSIVVSVPTDSLIKRQQGADFMKPGNFLIQHFKINKVYNTQAEVDSMVKIYQPIAEAKQKAKQEEMEKKAKAEAEVQAKKDDEILKDYLAKNNIKAEKTANGTYVQIITPGTGANIDTNNVAKVFYKGYLMNGKVFDSSRTNPQTGIIDPIMVNMTSDFTLGYPMINGWMEALKKVNNGTVAKLYVPSGQGYGPQARGEDIPANSILIFDITVKDVVTKEQAKALMLQQQKDEEARNKEIQKHFGGGEQPAAPKKKK